MFKKFLILFLLALCLNACLDVKPDKDAGAQDAADATENVKGTAENPTNLPEFTLPPPRPSDLQVLPNDYFDTAIKLKDVEKEIREALFLNEYTRISYYYVSGGFAMITQLEQIDEAAVPAPDPYRWVTNGSSIFKGESFSLKDYFKQLFNAYPGYYRCIVFLVTADSFSTSEKAPTKELADSWMDEGLQKLPNSIGDQLWSEDHSVTVLVYEFIKYENEEDIIINIPTANPGKHLIRSGILESFEK